MRGRVFGGVSPKGRLARQTRVEARARRKQGKAVRYTRLTNLWTIYPMTRQKNGTPGGQTAVAGRLRSTQALYGAYRLP